MAKLVIPRGMSIDKALKIFNSMCEKEQILSTFKKYQVYVKPSDSRRAAKMASIRKHRKNLAREKAKEERREARERHGRPRNKNKKR